MFELGKAGWVLAVVGLIFLLTIGRKLLPDRETLASILQGTESKQYLTEVFVVADSPLVGKTLAATPLANQPKARILEVIRAGERPAPGLRRGGCRRNFATSSRSACP